MSEHLLPCPFCGGDPEIVHIEEGENAGGSCVCCTRCMASSNVEFEFKENFVSNWNRRPPTEAKPVAALVETSIDTMREAANDELRRNGWHKQPNARLALHQVKELMAAFGMHVYRGEVGCNWPNCGCCADAACADALPALASLDNHKDQRS